jgi:uncharacterized membrane protein
MFVAFIPFPTDLLAESYDHESNVVILLYALSHMFTGLSLLLLWGYAVRNRRLVPAHIDSRVVRGMTRVLLAGPLLYGVAGLLSFVHHAASLIFFAVIPVYYLVPGRIDQHWMTLGHRRHPAE